MHMLKRGYWSTIGIFCLMLLAGCGRPSPLASSSSAASPTSTVTATAIPATPTTVSGSTTFTCPESLNGAQKTFSDTSMQFSFSYPAAWTETSCQRFTAGDGQQTILIGNLFSVSIAPRNGQTIQQWVNSRVDQYEVVTLGTLAVPHAQEAATVSVAPSATSDPDKPFAAEPFVQTFAIVAGSQYFYTVNGFVAQMSMTDTMPGLSRQQLAQQVVSTFVVA